MIRPKLQVCQKVGLTLLTSPEEVADDGDWSHRVPAIS